MSIVEAFSVGTPVICSDLGNAGSVVEDGITGYKFDYKSVDEIVKAIENIGENIIHIKRIEKIYESKYNETVNYKIMENIYDTLGAEKHKA